MNKELRVMNYEFRITGHANKPTSSSI